MGNRGRCYNEKSPAGGQAFFEDSNSEAGGLTSL
jgi:hypothetical protein